MLNALLNSFKNLYTNRYDTLLFLVLMLSTYGIAMPMISGTVFSIVFSSVWGAAMWYGSSHFGRLEDARLLNNNKNNWKAEA